MKKRIVFVTHEFGLFWGHGGVAEYLNILVTQILKRTNDYEIYILTIVCDKESRLLRNKHVVLYLLKPGKPHEIGNEVLNYLKEIKPDIVECTDYMSLGLEALFYRYETPSNELSNTRFITVHHTASRECYEWNDKVPVRFSPEFIRECFAREKSQMKLSDLNVAPSSFMRGYVIQNYKLNDVITILHPLSIMMKSREELVKDVSRRYDISCFGNKFIICCISRIEGRKNQELLVKQFVRFLDITGEDAILFLGGNSAVNSVTGIDFREEIYDLIPEKYIFNIHFFDFMTYEEKVKIYAISDLGILASTYECLSLSVVESVCHGVPVITSKYCGFSDYMEEVVNIMTFDPFREDDLLKKLLYFYRSDSDERVRILDYQYNGLLQKANYSETVDKRLAIYNSCKVVCESNNYNCLIVDENNYYGLIDESIIDRRNNVILVNFKTSPQNINKMQSIAGSILHKFEDGAVICFAEKNVQFEFVNIIENEVPFFIKGIYIERDSIGMTFADIVVNYGIKAQIYNLPFRNKTERNTECGHCVNARNIKKEKFGRNMLANYFYKENLINMEEKYAE